MQTAPKPERERNAETSFHTSGPVTPLVILEKPKDQESVPSPQSQHRDTRSSHGRKHTSQPVVTTQPYTQPIKSDIQPSETKSTAATVTASGGVAPTAWTGVSQLYTVTILSKTQQIYLIMKAG